MPSSLYTPLLIGTCSTHVSTWFNQRYSISYNFLATYTTLGYWTHLSSTGLPTEVGVVEAETRVLRDALGGLGRSINNMTSSSFFLNSSILLHTLVGEKGRRE